jgi:hypothetical protein
MNLYLLLQTTNGFQTPNVVVTDKPISNKLKILQNCDMAFTIYS